jgi:quinol monooxygenase YgiN
LIELTEVSVGEEIAWRVELSIKPDQVGNLLALTDEMVESASAEEGCLSYKRFISPDGESVHLYERYLNSAAAQAHLTIFSERFKARFAGMVDRKNVTFAGMDHPSVAARLARNEAVKQPLKDRS